jgi:hypothetical protein
VEGDPEKDRLDRVAFIRDRTDAEVSTGGVWGAAFLWVPCSFALGFTCCVVVVAVMGQYSHTVGEFRGGVMWLSWFGAVLGFGSLGLTSFRVWCHRERALL